MNVAELNHESIWMGFFVWIVSWFESLFLELLEPWVSIRCHAMRAIIILCLALMPWFNKLVHLGRKRTKMQFHPEWMDWMSWGADCINLHYNSFCWSFIDLHLEWTKIKDSFTCAFGHSPLSDALIVICGQNRRTCHIRTGWRKTFFNSWWISFVLEWTKLKFWFTQGEGR